MPQNSVQIRLPLQARSRETMDRILTSFGELLRERPYERITMTELAKVSGAGASSIYARFKDKSALVLGVHMRVGERAIACLEGLVMPERWNGKTNRQVVHALATRIMSFYSEHDVIIRAALNVDSLSVRELQANNLRKAAEMFDHLFKERMACSDARRAAAIDACCRLYASAMYSKILFENAPLTRRLVSDRKLAHQLGVAMAAILEEAESPASD